MGAYRRLLLVGFAWSIAAPTAQVGAVEIDIQAAEHHLGDGAGNQGTVFIKEFEVSRVLNDPHLELTFQSPGPNFESPPSIYINGESLGSIQPFFPPLEAMSTWQINPDGSHDFNDGFQVSLPVAPLLRVGTNRFTIVSGRPDDDYKFSNVRIAEAVAATPAPIAEPDVATEASDTVCARRCEMRACCTQPVRVWRRCRRLGR